MSKARRLAGALTVFLFPVFSPFSLFADPISLLDPSFKLGSGPDAAVNAAVLGSDGRVVIGGAFTHIDGRWAPHLARLNTDGVLDPGFLAEGGPDGEVTRLFSADPAELLVAGSFSRFADQLAHGVVRVDAEGHLDPGFEAGNWVGVQAVRSTVMALGQTAEGQIIVGGSFSLGAGGTAGRVARLNPDGSLDAAFAPSSAEFPGNACIYAVLPLADGSVLVGGAFDSIGGRPIPGLARLGPDGIPDSLTAFLSAPATVYVIQRCPDGKILIGGLLDSTPGSVKTLRRLNGDLSWDATFQPPPISDTDALPAGPVTAVLIEPGDNLVFGGSFYEVGGYWRRFLGRVSPLGEVDAAFDPGLGFGGFSWQPIRALLRQPDGKIIAGGEFVGFDGGSQPHLVRLYAGNRDGVSRVYLPAPRATGLWLGATMPAGQTNVLEASSNLVDWVSISTNPPPFFGQAVSTHPEYPWVFYRLRGWP
jgi:uncharacterized delta-60 repeat protein